MALQKRRWWRQPVPMLHLLHRQPASSTVAVRPGVDLPLPGAIADRIEWRMTGDHLVVHGVRSPHDRLADPDCRRLEWFEHRLRIHVAVLGAAAQVVNTPDGPHLLVGPAPDPSAPAHA
jgi:hypothetical protein